MNFQPLPLPPPRFQAPRNLLAPVRQCECNCLTTCSCSCPCRDHCTCKATCDGACAAHLPRNLVVCLDDISTKPGSENTNVIELYRRVLADINQSQLTYYDCAGIQSHHSGIFQAWLRPIKYAMDRALGLTLKKTVLKAYRWLCEQYRPGDQIFLFGFARGAYQARILGDMIQRVGLVNAGNPDLVALSYEVYLETGSQQGT
ncbi:hypothetical protein C8R46DRAFT_386010 [Mycena filopes]|nr:hypothetical protein C8R46DRAFT_386010 [Mycena filopes]